jgi:hypothetical protein
MYNKMSESKQPKLTKKGLPDKRAETSKKNLEKGKNIIKQALKESKVAKSKAPIIDDSSDEETDDDDDEYEFELLPRQVVVPATNPEPATEDEPEIEEEEPEVEVKPKKKGGKSKEMIQNLYNEIQTLRQSNEEVRSMFTKQQNDMNKKRLNTHIGILNQEMLLKF